ncbi:hypothetical protein D770_05365 [Flammeovirgaceae bacterium 311]|nr:hypothetical protein D770_05365 [Flammeovirgaceae bacterium 311]
MSEEEYTALEQARRRIIEARMQARREAICRDAGVPLEKYGEYMYERFRKIWNTHRRIKLISLMRLGIEAMGKEDFRKWLNSPNFHFDGKPPASYLDNIAGIEYTHSRIIGMEYGDNA